MLEMLITIINLEGNCNYWKLLGEGRSIWKVQGNQERVGSLKIKDMNINCILICETVSMGIQCIPIENVSQIDMYIYYT